MKNKVCIILRSAYPYTTTQHIRFNEEVESDTITVRETLTDYDIFEIIIPVFAKHSEIITRINYALASISKQYEQCHIVLNTHGSPGLSDLPHESVKKVIQGLSQLTITVTQISALLCNGMLSPYPKDSSEFLKSMHGSMRRRKSSLSILQKKLQHMETQIPMSFEIRGCIDAYDPIEDKDLVIGILKGKLGISLPVFTPISRFSSPDFFLQTLQSIKVINETPHSSRGKTERYNRAANILGITLNRMKDNVFDFLNHTKALSPENIPLFNALKDFAKSQDLNSCTLQIVYKQWLKKYKIFSEQRISVLEKYCKQCFLQLEPPKPPEASPPKLIFPIHHSSYGFFDMPPKNPEVICPIDIDSRLET